jgi:hypothetical protein
MQPAFNIVERKSSYDSQSMFASQMSTLHTLADVGRNKAAFLNYRSAKMKSTILLDIIDKRIDDIACNDFYFIPGIILSCAQMGRLNHLRNHSRVIDSYFRSSPEVFDIVKNYRPMRLLKFLERVVRFRAQNNKVNRFTSANKASPKCGLA